MPLRTAHLKLPAKGDIKLIDYLLTLIKEFEITNNVMKTFFKVDELENTDIIDLNDK